MARPKKGITFWDRLYSQTKHNGTCIEFTGSKDDCGYGRINKGGRLVRVHRAVWEREFGAIPSGFVVMHKCDNPPCINPLHLAIGPQSANIKDMWEKGRARSAFGNQNLRGKHINVGAKHVSAKFTDEDILAIRAQLAVDSSDQKRLALAAQYKVSKGAINHILYRTRWRHVGS